MTPRDKAMTAVSLFGVFATFYVGANPKKRVSMTPLFWAAGVTLWCLAPFGLALALAATRQRKW